MWLRKKRKLVILVFALLGILFYISLPKQLFSDPYSTVLQDRTGNLLSASIATDGSGGFRNKIIFRKNLKTQSFCMKTTGFIIIRGLT